MCYVSMNNIKESMEREKNRKAHGQFICEQFMVVHQLFT